MRSTTDNLVRAIHGLKDPGDLNAFLGELFTGPERRDFSLRWRLMELLHQGVPQRTIAARLGVSLCKITRGSKIVKNPASVTRRVLDQTSQQQPKQPHS